MLRFLTKKKRHDAMCALIANAIIFSKAEFPADWYDKYIDNFCYLAEVIDGNLGTIAALQCVSEVLRWGVIDEADKDDN